jgi:glycosyltransferase involved in cell wall biosynthesis
MRLDYGSLLQISNCAILREDGTAFLMFSIRRYYNSLKLVVMGSDFFSQGGAWRSIYLYTRYEEARGEAMHLLDLRGPRNLRQFVAAALFAPRILVNGLGSFAMVRVLLLCLIRRDVIVYLHETAYFLDRFAQLSPLRHGLLARILKRNPILCVSQQAAALYRARYGAVRTHVVYECPGGEEPPVFEAGRTHLVMVGSMDERKGIELFSKVADLAATNCPDWQFHWVGGMATRSKLYQSNTVKWHGWQWHPRDFIRQANLFFLSSLDDPCPLGALEALALGKRCVAYSKTGTAELIEGIDGCAVFNDYTPDSALVALEKAMKIPLDPVRLRQIGDSLGIESFSNRLESFVESLE